MEIKVAFSVLLWRALLFEPQFDFETRKGPPKLNPTHDSTQTYQKTGKTERQAEKKTQKTCNSFSKSDLNC